MNLAALIGEVASTVEAESEVGDAVSFTVAVPERGGDPQVLRVQAKGKQAAACREYLRPGHRVAVEGRVAPAARSAEVLADRVQFLTTRAQARALARPAA
jgi:single-stranded DNA-binding protein